MKDMYEYKLFTVAVEDFMDFLFKKRAWRLLDEKLSYYKNKGWKGFNIVKISQWERLAYEMYTESNDISLKSIKVFAHSLSTSEFLKLETWIKTSKHSLDAWKKSSISIEDSEKIIQARLIHLAYMAIAAKPISIGNIMAKEE